jgi:predicted DNA-binding transcriptional regulator AlpA
MTEVLVGTKEVAALLGVSRQRVNRIAQTHPEFPRPVGQLAAGRVWKRKDILEWATKRGLRNLSTASR